VLDLHGLATGEAYQGDTYQLSALLATSRRYQSLIEPLYPPIRPETGEQTVEIPPDRWHSLNHLAST